MLRIAQQVLNFLYGKKTNFLNCSIRRKYDSRSKVHNSLVHTWGDVLRFDLIHLPSFELYSSLEMPIAYLGTHSKGLLYGIHLAAIFVSKEELGIEFRESLL